MNTVGSTYQNFIKDLETHYEPDEARAVTSMVFEQVAGLSRIDITIKSDQFFESSDLDKLKRMLTELKTGKPIQYITGYTWFLGNKIFVNENVLIPRRETEELVDWIVRDIKSSPKIIVDYCTGSGCIAIALKKIFPDAQVIGIDISEKALEVASGNASINSVNVEWIQSDLLSVRTDIKADLIVSNPPYVLNNERKSMPDRVKKFEPAKALFVPDNDPLIFYRQISKLALKYCPVGAMIYYEINEVMGKEISDLHSQLGYTDYILKKDMQEKDRFFKASLPALSL